MNRFIFLLFIGILMPLLDGVLAGVIFGCVAVVHINLHRVLGNREIVAVWCTAYLLTGVIMGRLSNRIAKGHYLGLLPVPMSIISSSFGAFVTVRYDVLSATSFVLSYWLAGRPHAGRLD